MLEKGKGESEIQLNKYVSQHDPCGFCRFSRKNLAQFIATICFLRMRYSHPLLEYCLLFLLIGFVALPLGCGRGGTV